MTLNTVLTVIEMLSACVNWSLTLAVTCHLQVEIRNEALCALGKLEEQVFR